MILLTVIGFVLGVMAFLMACFQIASQSDESLQRGKARSKKLGILMLNIVSFMIVIAYTVGAIYFIYLFLAADGYPTRTEIASFVICIFQILGVTVFSLGLIRSRRTRASS